MTLKDILDFTKLTLLFQSVDRVVSLPGRNHPENDAEHSYQLAMLAWYLLDEMKLTHLDRDLVIRYALIHDMVETYAGDTFFFASEQERLEKIDREHAAAERLKTEFPNFTGFTELIEQYEKREDPEARFVYALDKIIPTLNIYLDGGGLWKMKGITLQILIEKKRDKVALSPELTFLFDELIELLQSQENELF